jgi:hypothetical protein
VTLATATTLGTEERSLVDDAARRLADFTGRTLDIVRA